jgi:tetratricopeptide (TPR) repeat protein
MLIELDPYFTDYLTERAKVSRKRGDFAGALADYDRAIELVPPFTENYYTRATARLAVGDVACSRPAITAKPWRTCASAFTLAATWTR